MELLLNLLSVYLLSAPLYLVWIIGIGLAITSRAANPAAARLVGLALAILLISSLAQTFLGVYLPQSMIGAGSSPTQVGAALAGVNAGFMLLHCLIWILVLLAVFRRRSDA